MTYTYNKSYELKLDKVIEQALDDYPRTFAVRLDLRLPTDEYYCPRNNLMTLFIDSLKSQIKAHERRKSKFNRRIHKTKVRYVWARECHTSHNEHYHLLLLLNADAYFRVGAYDSTSSLAYRIIKAWASALDLDIDEVEGLVNFTRHGEYRINTNADNFDDELNALFDRARYLCKEETKLVNPQYRSFGYSYR